MPELPEVETVKKTLNHLILNQTIQSVVVNCNRMIQTDSVDSFCSKLVGETFQKIERYGKYLIFYLTNYVLVSHLRMEGKYFYQKSSEQLNPYIHVIFHLTNGFDLRYQDVRKFGTFQLMNMCSFNELLKKPPFCKMGPEATNSSLTGVWLHQILSTKTAPIKSILLDQQVISGLGNIYVDEVLFLAGVNPLTIGKDVDVISCNRILFFMNHIMRQAILAGGTTIRSYTSSLGVSGLFQFSLVCHSLVDKPCYICNSPIKKIKVGGRGTYFCPHCQMIPWPKVIGVTGSIASGKTQVDLYLKKLMFDVIDCDSIAHDVLKSDIDVKKEIAKYFGQEVLLPSGEINREKLGYIVFHSEESKTKLEQITHPSIYKTIVYRIRNEKAPIVFLDAPLLFETGLDKICNETIVVSTSIETQIQRLMARDGIDKEYAIQKIKGQMSLADKIKKATYVIDNTGSIDETNKQIDKIIKEILKG